MNTEHGTGAERHRIPRRHWRRGSGIAVGVAVVLVILSGCAGSNASGGSSSTLKVGIASLSTSDALDPAMASTPGGYAIATNVFSALDTYGPGGAVDNQLAESLKPGSNAADWTLKLKKAEWSNGKPVTADDVIYTFRRWFDKKLPPASSLPFLDPSGMKKVNERTVEFTLKYPTVAFRTALASPTMAIVPRGFDPQHPIGSGPFVLSNNQPGTRLTFTANTHYFEKGQPGFRELQLISFPDSTSMVNALVGGQIDVASSIDPSQVAVVKAAGSKFTVFAYPTSGTLTWQMNVDKKPFDNPDVREALRLAVNRPQLISQVYHGYAKVGNDIFSPYDPGYNQSLPQRKQDIARAKALLAEAGYPNGVDVQLTAAPIQPTANLQNEVLVQQAAAAGFHIQFNKVDTATYYGDSYGTYPLSLSFWGDLGILDQAAFTLVNNAPYNATHWQDDEYNSLYEQAVRTVSDSARDALERKMQQVEYDSGPYIVAAFLDNVSVYSSSVTGYRAYPNTDGPSGYNFADLHEKG